MRMGVDYYPEHWPEERWPTDARLMREAGISLVRLAEFAWSRLEPREGTYDFAWLDRALAVLHAEGIEAVLGTPTAAPPAWLHQRYPDIFPADARRYRMGFGTRLQRCLNNPEMRRYARSITEAMAAYFANNPAVIGWQIDNELEANLCYCQVCAERFRAWLRERYGTLEALNRTWGTVFWSQEYSDWQQIPLPWEARCGRSHNPSLFLDYRRFASESAVDFLREQAEIIRRLAPRHIITHNLMGLHDSMDYFALGDQLDLVSWDNYPLGFWGGTDRTALAHDVMRGIKGRGFWVMEEQAGITGWERMGRRPAPGQLRAWAWQAVARGAEAVVFFRWRSCLYGTEQYWHGILNHDGLPRRRYREIAQLGRELADLAPELEGGTVRAAAAILNDYEQNWALQIQPQAEGLGWWEQTARFHRALSEQGLNVDLVPIGAELARYRAVIVPSWYLLDQGQAGRLAEYARRGGVLILNPRTGVKNPANTCHPLPLPGPLREAAGIEVDDYDALGRTASRIRLWDGRVFSVSVWADALRLDGAEEIAAYADAPFAGEPAAARHAFGDGAVYYLGTYGEPAFYRHLVTEILSGTDQPAIPDLPEEVDAVWREKEGRRDLFLINLAGEERAVPIPEGARVRLGEAPRNGKAILPPYGVGIYLLDRE